MVYSCEADVFSKKFRMQLNSLIILFRFWKGLQVGIVNSGIRTPGFVTSGS